MIFTPTTTEYATLRRGDKGWKAWVIQIGLNDHLPSPGLVEDGDFGPLTESAARIYQKAEGITPDGIVGPQTQLHLCLNACARDEKGRTPPRMLEGIVRGESGGSLVATSAVYPSGTRDFGPAQVNMPANPQPSQSALRNAYAPNPSILALANQLVARHKEFAGKPGCVNHEPEEAWRLAVLFYNWQEAAVDLAYKHDVGYLYNTYKWVEEASGGKLHTGWEWVDHYISSKLDGYVTSWAVA